MLEYFHIVVIKINPDLNPVHTLVVFRRDKPKAIDMLGMIEILAHQIEDYISVELVLILLCFTNWKHESPSVLISDVLPLGLDILLEELDRVYDLPLLINEVAKIWYAEYLFCLLSLLTKKWSRLLSL